MLNLIIKDLLIQKRQLLLGIIYIPFTIFIFQSIGAAVFSAGAVAFVYMLVVTSCAIEDKDKADIMINSLPVNRNRVVAAKYLSVLLYFIMATFTYVLTTGLIGIFKSKLNIYSLNLELFVGGLSAVSLMASIYYPVFFKFGYIKSKVFIFLLFFMFFFGVSSIIEYLHNSNNNGLTANLLGFFEAQNSFTIILFTFAVLFLFLMISYSLSVSFYKKREF